MMLTIKYTKIKYIGLALLLLFLVSTAQASTTFYFRDPALSEPMPNVKQSGDTIRNDSALSVATYANPAYMNTTQGSTSRTNEGSFGGTTSQHFTHYGSFITPPLAGPQTVSGTVTCYLTMREQNANQNNYPRIYIYIWKNDDTKGSNILTLTNSPTEVSTNYAGGPIQYFNSTSLTSQSLNQGDKIVLELETSDTPTETTARAHGLRFGGASNFNSYCTFSATITVLQPPITDFNANTTSICQNGWVALSDASTNNPTMWQWSFGDGTANSTSQNTIHQYVTTGQKTIALTTCNQAGCTTSTKTSYITVNPLCAASFTTNITSMCQGGTIGFADTSFGTPTQWNWSFGGGSEEWFNTTTSSLKNATHTYTTAGTFNPYLIATNGCGFNTSSLQQITVNPLVSASFTRNQTSICPNGVIQFNDTSTGSPTNWLWQWGDGTANSTEQNATHQFTAGGTYQVNLTATGTCGSNTTTNQQVTVNPLCVASFTKNASTICQNESIRFTDTSVGDPSSWLWQFGDGSVNATTKNSDHQFATPGPFNVNLTATSVCDSNLSSNQEVTVNPLTIANFSDNSTSQCGQVTIGFTDTSNGSPISWLWEYSKDDGTWTQLSTDQNPVQIFSTPGVYSIRLTASNGCGSNTYTKLNEFSVFQVPTVRFSGSPTAGNALLAVDFTDSSIGSPTQWNWTFGDGSTSSMQNLTHRYMEAGIYNVSLLISTANGCTNSTTQLSYITVNMNTSFTANQTSGTTDLPVQFTDTSLGSPDSWYWEFGDGAMSTDQNPFHTYTQVGAYDVTFRACRGLSCDWENKTHYITVKQKLAPPRAYISLSGGSSTSHVGTSDAYVVHPDTGKPYPLSFGNVTPISKIILTLREPVSDLFVRVEQLDSLPSDVSPPPGYVYGYIGVNVDATNGNIVNFATIDFSVKKSWLEGSSYAPHDIELIVYRNGRWEILPTEYLSQGEDELYYQAKTVGLPHYFVIVGMTPAEVDEARQATVITFDSFVGWVMENPVMSLTLVVALVIVTYTVFRQYLLKMGDKLLPEERPEEWEIFGGLFEGEKQKAYSTIINSLNHIDAQLLDIDLTIATKGSGYVFSEGHAKAIVDKFFFSCQVAERRIKAAAAYNYITKEQVTFLNWQLMQAVDRMITTSKQSDVLIQFVRENLGVAVEA